MIVADSGIFRIAHQMWQRANITAVAAYLREVLAREPDNARVRVLHDGLLDVMDPTRRLVRQQREMSAAAAIVKQERRSTERRVASERRQKKMTLPEELERRRSGPDRRAARDRRKP
jgi:hypothetical protein